MFDDGAMVVDGFAGGGGASTGIRAAIGREVDIAINHSEFAIAMHEHNHPSAVHYQEDVFAVDPVEATQGRPVRMMWLSPDCTHFSKAKGSKPRSKKTRALAWLAYRWARAVRPALFIIENVPEFITWGPLDERGHPCPRRAGRTFRLWVTKLRNLGYQVEWRQLVAADFGAPTTRKRLFVIARCDGERIRWPEPTHGERASLFVKPWRTAAECIDWSIPCPSIFARKRPLAPATLARIAAGLKKFVLTNARPFIVPLTHHGSAERVYSLDDHFKTITAANRGELALCAPTMIQTGYGEREGQAPRALNLHAPLGTVVSSQKHALVAAFISKAFGGPNGNTTPGSALSTPMATVTARDHNNLVAATLAPSPTDRRADVAAFLVKYYGGSGSPETQHQPISEPLHTVTSKARFGLVMVEGIPHEIIDIGMRMLEPHELFAAQGFPAHYRLDVTHNGKPLTKTALIELCGNSVCPPVAEALVRANVANDNAKRGAA